MNRSILRSPELTNIGTAPFGIYDNVPINLPVVPTDGASESHILIRSTHAPKEHDITLFGDLLPNLVIVGRHDNAPFRVAMATKADPHTPQHESYEPIFDLEYPPQNLTFVRPENQGGDWVVGHMPHYRHDTPGTVMDIEPLAIIAERQQYFDELIGIVVRVCRRSQANFIRTNSGKYNK